MNRYYVGWDIGGAHLKAVVVRGDGHVVSVIQHYCPLWQGLEELTSALASVRQRLPDRSFHGLTMTGEMADLFANRQEGVRALLDAFTQSIGSRNAYVYASQEFIPLSGFQPQNHHHIASQNWRLTAQFLARHQQSGALLCVDIGSTTTDFLPVIDGVFKCLGDDDHCRLRTGELIYSGVVRTPVMALSRQLPFRGEEISVMAEHFATMADVYRILQMLPPHADQSPTADGKPKTRQDSIRRLARMIGLDAESAPEQTWLLLAEACREMHWQRLTMACLRHLSHIQASQVCLVGAGVGRFLLPEIARRTGCTYKDYASFFHHAPSCPGDFSVSDCAPAAALAWLLQGALKEVPPKSVMINH